MKLRVAFSGGSAKLEPLPIHHCRRSVQRFEIRDQIGAFGVVLQAGVDHRRVGHHRASIGEVFIKGGGVPGDPELHDEDDRPRVSWRPRIHLISRTPSGIAVVSAI
jgi:hypothetical protein